MSIRADVITCCSIIILKCDCLSFYKCKEHLELSKKYLDLQNLFRMFHLPL